jgi:pimeloyl-ACP methyl ester carboxylesterase
VRGSEAPFGGGTRWLDRIVPERDLAIGGSTALMAIGAMGAEEDDLHGALRDGYDRMRATEGPIPSPILSTMLWGQRPGGHSMIAIDPPGDATSAVVFLHGFMGNITIACWHVAQAATAEGVAVMCPSTGWRAHWSGSDGLATVASTIDTLRRRGMKRIYLAGLSSGAIGASLGASMLDVDGVILISGAAPEAVPKRVPTLVLQGANDPRTRPGPARAYAQKLGDLARYIEHPEAGHWMILAEHVFVTEHIRGWLREQGPRD